MPDVTNSLLNAPLPELIERLGAAIANAQAALDRNSIEQAKIMADPDQGVEIDGRPASLLSLGFTPTFYAFTETTIEAKVAFSASESKEFTVGGSLEAKIYFVAASINASYTSKYSFDATGSSSISTRLVSLPPPGGLHELLLAQTQKGQAG